MKSLLITGGAGFIGVNFVHYWLGKYTEDRVIVLDALTYAGNLTSLDSVKDNPNYTFVHGNIQDSALVEELLRHHKVDTLVNFAAESHVDRSITGPDAFLETNIMGTHSLLKAAKKVWLDDDLLKSNEHRFHHVSTDEVYGTLQPRDLPFTEETPYAPNSPYAASKASSDHLVRAYNETYGLKTTISNCSNNYGPYHFPEKLIPLVITNILKNRPLPIYGDGKQIRDWLYVEDHLRGIDKVLESGKTGENYNIGGNNEWQNIDIVKLVCQLMNEQFQIADTGPLLQGRFPEAKAAISGTSESLITHIKDRPGHDRRYAIDAKKIQRELKYEPQETFETGIRKTINWYLDNESWWQDIISGDYQDWINKQYS